MSTLAPPPANPPPNLLPEEVRRRSWNMWCHMSALAGLLVPYGSWLGPLLVWQIKKHEVPSVESHGKAALNFQITFALAYLAATVATVVLMFVCIGYFLIPVLILFHFVGPIFAIIAGVKANDGQDYRYPCALPLFN